MYSDIIYIESRNNRCILHTADEEYPLYMKLDDIEQQMLDEKVTLSQMPQELYYQYGSCHGGRRTVQAG